MNITRRGAFSTIAALPLIISGCLEAPTDSRGKLYFDRRQDILSTITRLERGQQAVNNAILNSCDSLARSMQPDYLKFRASPETVEPLKDRKEKKTLGVLDIYSVDSEGVKMLESYLTDFMINCLFSNMRLGENFRIAERYKLSTLLGEYDIRKTSEFDPRDAIKRGLFKGCDAILTGNLYPSRQSYKTDSEGRKVVSYNGGIEFLLRMLDVTDADVIGTATEHISWSSAVEQWIDRSVRRR